MLAPQLCQQIIRWNPAKFSLHAHTTSTRRSLSVVSVLSLFTMAVLKRAKTLQASVLSFLKLWLSKLLAAGDSVSESKLEDLHEFLSPWLGHASATLLDDIMSDSELDSIFKVNACRVLFDSGQRRLSFTFLNEQFYAGIVQLLKRRGESLGKFKLSFVVLVKRDILLNTVNTVTIKWFCMQSR